MTFNSKLSIKQFHGMFYFVVGAIILYAAFQKSGSLEVLIKIIGAVIVLHGIELFIDDSIKKYKITHSEKENHYDSKSEEIIAGYFKRKNIIFEHHPHISVKKYFYGFTVPFHKVNIEPDFFLPEFDVFVEFWGLIEDEKYKKEQYDKKMKLYKDNNLDIISLYPKNLANDNLDWAFTSKLLELFKQRQGIDRNWR